MDKLQLPTVSLILIDCIDVGRSIKVIEHCKKMVDFGDVKFLTSLDTDYIHAVKIMPLKSLIAYSIFCLTRLHEYIDTDHLIVVQRDGFILNPQSFDNAWLQNDYTAPLFMQNDFVGSGGSSLRSKRIMQEVAKLIPEWDGTQENAEEIQRGIPFYEDGMLSLTKFSKDFKIATLEQGAMYGQGGNRNAKYFVEHPFSFHRTWQTVNIQTGRVDSSDTSRDLSITYDYDIDKYL